MNIISSKIAAKVIAVAMVCASFGLLGSVARAVPITPVGIVQIPGANQDISKNGTGIAGGNSNDDANNFFRLQSIMPAANLAYLGLPAPVSGGAVDVGNLSGDISVTGFVYAVLHYGKGSDGIGGGGGVAFYYLNGFSVFNPPDNGLGPNGMGGLSTVTLFKGNSNTPGVPDGGSTLVLFGLVLSGLGLLRRKLA